MSLLSSDIFKLRGAILQEGGPRAERIVYKMVMISTTRVEKESKPLYNASKAIFGKTF